MAQTPNLSLNYSFPGSLPHKSFVEQLSDNMSKIDSAYSSVSSALSSMSMSIDSAYSSIGSLSSTVTQHTNDINELTGVVETFSVSSWTADNNIAPYTYKATITINTTLNANSIVELLNDNALLFATYGFAIGSIAGQVATLYALEEPVATVSISIRIGGTISNSDGGSGNTLYQHFIRYGNATFSFNVAFVDTDSTSHDTSNILSYLKTYFAKGSTSNSSGYLIIPCNGFYGGTAHNQIVFYLMYNTSNGSLSITQAVGGTSYDISGTTPTFAFDSVIPLS